MYLLPVSLLLFQLQYAANLTWAVSALQNVPIVFFSLFTIALVCKKSTAAFAGACVALIFAIATSGNGFIVALVGLLILAQQKEWRRLPAWIATVVGMGCVYFYRYNFHSSQAAPGASVTRSFGRLNPAYALTFMGSSVAMNQKYLPSLICGIVLIGIFLFAIKKRYYIQNPAVFYSMVFILITAIGVSGLRSDFGITQSLASRYRIYSNVFLILSYIFWTETFLFEKSKRVQQTALAGVILVSFVFFCGSNIAGFRFLQGRKLATEQALAEWQNPSLASSPGDPQDQGDSAVRRQIANGMYKPNSEVLLESMRLGVYQPPVQTPGSK